ncbi:MAG: hypothetical protein ABH952_07845 [Candidatus Omnitrophota bacterium]
MNDYFREAKKNLENKIPDYNTSGFEKLRNKIREQLKKKENEQLIVIRRLKTLLLGDWSSKEKQQRLYDIKYTFLKNGLYAETIDEYYDLNKKDGLSQVQILEMCCITHQLIVFIDGTGAGTLTEQNYLADNYIFHGKVMYFIEKPKFDQLKSNPSTYVKDFPTIHPYTDDRDLLDIVLIYSRLRIYRLAEILQKQAVSGRGPNSPEYKSWEKRLSERS